MNPIGSRAPSNAPTFSWPTGAMAVDKDGRRWRVETEHTMQWLKDDAASADPILCVTVDRFNAVRQLTRALICFDKSQPGSGGRNDGGRTADRRAVLTWLGGIPWRMGQNVIMSCVCSHIEHWVSRATAVAWLDVPAPEWLLLEGENVADMYDIRKTHTRGTYYPWIDQEATDLHGDLVAFFTAFLNMRAAGPQDNLIASPALAGSCVLLRALGVAASDRMPASTVELVDRMEKQLNVEVLKKHSRITLEMYRGAHAAWDHQVLDGVEGAKFNEKDRPTKSPRRTL